MTDNSASVSPTLRAKVSTGYGRLDEALQGGFLSGSCVVLCAPACDEVPLLLRRFLLGQETGLLICRTLSSADIVTDGTLPSVKSLVCSDKPVPPSKNVIPGKGIDNLTDVNLQINEALGSVQPKRVVLDILSDVLLRHRGLQTRRWLTELLERFRSKSVTVLAVLNPYMHSSGDVQAVVDLFDGNIEIFEKEGDGALGKLLRIKWMHGVGVSKKELSLVALEASEPQTGIEEIRVATAPLKEPRWRTLLVSRVEELTRLKALFDDALTKKGSVVVLQGESGVGKTRIMQELAAYALSKNSLVLSGTASDDRLPYAPWIEAARQYVAQAPGEVLRRMLGANAAELVKLIPDLTAKLGTIPPSKPLGDQDKLRFYEAVSQFFMAVCKDTPLLLLFDDMQYIDQPSLDLLEYFVRSASNLPILTVCSYPTEDVPPDAPLRQTMMKFNKQRLLETVLVRNLNKEETVELIRQTFGEQTISSEFADLIHNRTGGNPFFVEEVLRSLVEDGTIFRTDKGWDRKPMQDIAIPESVKSTLKSRLSRLDQETVGALTTAAVIGAEFDFQVLMEVMQTPRDTLLERIEETISSGLILEDRQRKGVLKFADNRIRELLLHELSELRKTSYHLRIVEAMEKRYADDLQSQAQNMAFHSFEGSDPERAVKYSIMAGGRNVAVCAYEQAVQDFKEALGTLEGQTGKDEEKGKVIEELAGALDLAGQEQDSCKYYEQALGIFDKLHDFKSCMRISVGLSRALYRAGPAGTQESLSMLKRNMKYLQEDTESFEAADFYSELAWREDAIGQHEEARGWNEWALRAGEKSKNFSAVSEALLRKGGNLLDVGSFDEGMPFIERACELALQHEQYLVAANNLLNLSFNTLGRDVAKAQTLVSRAIELNQRHIRSPRMEASAYSTLSAYHWYNGDWTLALDDINKALDLADRLGFTNDYIIFGEVHRARYLLHVGDQKTAERYLEASRAKQGTVRHQIYLDLAFGELRSDQGRVDDAKENFEKCLKAIREQKPGEEWYIEPLLYLTLIYVERGQRNEARETYALAKSLGAQYSWDTYGPAMALQTEAAVLLADGNQKDAEEALIRSLALWDKAGWPYYKAKALVAYSESIAQTNPEEQNKRLQQAAEIFRRLGAKRDLEKAETKLSAQSWLSHE